ncbi:class I SAM-dependent methyltransferase [Flavobacterium sp.]|uniref:class I SAM-dependent methyltransferase n=1 Tax=Flavobacterium sp. TaxID=239 RepID=UPI0025F65BB8|nr:class I SAM-dependent methyltransferase [Flavobacterium sp.]
MQRESLLAREIQDLISQNLTVDVTKLALQKNKFSNQDWIAILNQITAKQKALTKLPTWFNTKNIIYPSKVSVEQTSSEKTADYKSKLVSGSTLIDMTGGLGVDDYYFAQRIQQVIHCEINPELSQIVAYNYEQLHVKNIQCLTGDSADIIKKLNQKFDWIYIDPSRRNESKGKVFMLNDCSPNVPELLDFYFNFSDKIMIKTAPILDITAGLSELKNVSSIHVVALENEVKELLWVLQKSYNQSITIIAVNLLKNNSEYFSFYLSSNTVLDEHSLPEKYLYEPNAAIMKAAGFKEITTQFEVKKLHQHSHLYTSKNLIDFPGRIFEILKKLDYNKQNMKSIFKGEKANITTRNFPETVDYIRNKWAIKDGGDLFCFFTTDMNNDKIVLLCNKLK